MEGRSTISGVAQLSKQLLELNKLEDGKALSRACRAGMKPVFEQAQATIPVGTEPHRTSKTYGRQLVAPGFAKRSLRLATKRFDGQRASAFVTTLKAAFYALLFVEFGTRYQSPRPWLRRALNDRRAELEIAFKESMQKSVDKAAKTQ